VAHDGVLHDAVSAYRERARVAAAHGCWDSAWAALEATHILGQRSTWMHVRAHLDMLDLAARTGDRREWYAQVARVFGGAVVTWAWVPDGNTGRADMSVFASAPLPADLAAIRDRARTQSDDRRN
jgi:hypothetical protein